MENDWNTLQRFGYLQVLLMNKKKYFNFIYHLHDLNNLTVKLILSKNNLL
jgi:hypothetical protein